MKYETRLDKIRIGNHIKVALVTEIFDINVIDHRGRDLGKCHSVDIWHNDDDLTSPSYYAYRDCGGGSAECVASGKRVAFEMEEDPEVIRFYRWESLI